MEAISLVALGAEQLDSARQAAAGRAALTLVGGTGRVLRQTVLALVAGSGLDEHENPGEATLLVVSGRVRLRTETATVEVAPHDLVVIPDERHGLDALEDSVVLLTVGKRA